MKLALKPECEGESVENSTKVVGNCIHAIHPRAGKGNRIPYLD